MQQLVAKLRAENKRLLEDNAKKARELEEVCLLTSLIFTCLLCSCACSQARRRRARKQAAWRSGSCRSTPNKHSMVRALVLFAASHVVACVEARSKAHNGLVIEADRIEYEKRIGEVSAAVCDSFSNRSH